MDFNYTRRAFSSGSGSPRPGLMLQFVHLNPHEGLTSLAAIDLTLCRYGEKMRTPVGLPHRIVHGIIPYMSRYKSPHVVWEFVNPIVLVRLAKVIVASIDWRPALKAAFSF